MTFTFACRHCGVDNRAELGQAGRPVDCQGCGKSVVIPAPHEPAPGAAPAPEPALRFACPDCQRKYATKPAMAGKTVRCGGCGRKLRVPGATAPGSSSTSRPALKVFGTGPESPGRSGTRAAAPDPLAPAVDLGLLEAAAAEAAPAGRRPRASGGEYVESVLPSRSEKMAEVEEIEAEKAAAEAARKEAVARKKAKAGKKKKSSGGLEPKEIAGIFGVTAASGSVLAGLAYAAPALRFPIGAMLILVGGLTYIFGTYGFSHVAREEGAMYSLFCKFVPCYKWYYLYSRWDMMKGHFAFYVVGLALLTPGWFIVRASPDWREMESGGRSPTRGPSAPGAAPRAVPAALAPVADDGPD